jgi:uncharacterized membrane protein YkvA (DUF1232 family)
MSVLLAIAGGLAVGYVILLAVLVAARPKGKLLTEALRLLPNVLGLIRRLAADRSMPRAVRLRLWLLLGYLAIPIDLVPDFVPVLGHADDAIVVSLVLRSVVRRAGAPAIHRHWRGSDAGLAAVTRLAGLPIAPASSRTD